MFQESYFTIRYDEAKKKFPNTFGFDVGLKKWENNDDSHNLTYWLEFVVMARKYEPFLIKQYEQREICAETPARWMWYLDRKFSQLCEKYADAIATYPGFTLINSESKHEIDTKTKSNYNNDIKTSTDSRNQHLSNDSYDNLEKRDLTQKTEGKTTPDLHDTTTNNLTDHTDASGAVSHHVYPHVISQDHLETYLNTVSDDGNHSKTDTKHTGSVTLDKTGSTSVDDKTTDTGTINTRGSTDNMGFDVSYGGSTNKSKGDTEGSNKTTDTYQTTSDKVLRWQELVQKRKPLINQYLNEFNDMFISVVGLQLMPRDFMNYWGSYNNIFWR